MITILCIQEMGGKEAKQPQFRSYLELVYLVTALVPSDTACLASSPGRSRRTAVWISREVIVDLHKIINTVKLLKLPLVVMGQLARLGSNPLKKIIHE